MSDLLFMLALLAAVAGPGILAYAFLGLLPGIGIAITIAGPACYFAGRNVAVDEATRRVQADSYQNMREGMAAPWVRGGEEE